MTEAITRRRAFFVSPIGDDESPTRRRSDKVLEHILRPALVEDVVTAIERADENPNPGEITSAVIATLLEVDLVIADLTDSNPNEFYEVALAHAFGKPVVHIRHASKEPIPFDIKDIRVFPYSFDIADGETAKSQIRNAALHALAHPESVQTPVDRGRIIAQAASSPDLAERTNAEVLERLDRLDSRLGTLLRNNVREPRLSATEAHLIRTVRRVATAEGMLELIGGEDFESGYVEARRNLESAVEEALAESASSNRHRARNAQGGPAHDAVRAAREWTRLTRDGGEQLDGGERHDD